MSVWLQVPVVVLATLACIMLVAVVADWLVGR